MFRNREDFERDRPPRMRLEEEIAAMEHEKRTAIVSFTSKRLMEVKILFRIVLATNFGFFLLK